MPAAWHSGRIALRLALMLAALAAVTVPVRASFETDLIERWYFLLSNADASGLSGLLAPRARIALGDLGVTQNKQQFLDSMQEWQTAIDGGKIDFKVEGTSAGRVSALVCYRFKANEMLTREQFRIVAGRITQNNQAKLADSCKGF